MNTGCPIDLDRKTAFGPHGERSGGADHIVRARPEDGSPPDPRRGRGIYHGEGEARSWVSGVVRGHDGHWERFQERKVITLFDNEVIIDLLRSTGWSTAWPAAISDPATPLTDPEEHDRILFVAS